MEIFVYREGLERVQEGFTADQLPALLKEEKSVIWVDMEAPTEADDEVLSNIFHFHPLVIEDCRENRSHPKVEQYPDYIYFIVHGVRADTGPDRFFTIELDGFIGKNYVITYHHDMFRSINNVKQLVRTTPTACQRGPTFLMYHVLDQVVDYYSPVLDEFDERIDILEDDIFTLKQPNNRILEEVMDMKRSVLRLRRISSKQMEVLYRMSRGEFPLVDQSMLPFYRDIYDHLVRVTDLAESYRDLISGALEAYLSVVSNRLNEIMKVLTIFSAIMLPLTFIAGVYGMNFENMPELQTRNGYYVVWIVMIVVASLMLGFFWKRGWIGASDKKTSERRRR